MNRFLRSFVLVTASVVLLANAGCTQSMRKSRHLSKANQYFAAGELEKAELEYLNVLQLDAAAGDALAGLGQVYFEQGRTSRVFAVLNRARELVPDNVNVRDKLATVYLNAGSPKEARAEAVFVLGKKPDDPEAPLILAQASASAADAQDARARLAALPARLHDSAPVLTATGILDLNQRQLPAAEAAFEKARKADPKFVPAYLGLVALYRGRNDAAHAEEAFATAVTLSPIRSGVRIQYAQFELQTGHADVAKRVLNEILAKAPDCLPPYLALANVEAKDGHYDAATALVDKVLARDSIEPDALALSAQLKLAAGDAAGAATILERAINAYPQAGPFHRQLGAVYAVTGDLAKATSSLNEAIRLDPADAGAILALSEIQLRQGNATAAVTNLKKLAQAHPESPEIRVALARAYARQGKPDDALAVYRDLDRAFPNNPQTFLLMGLAYLQQDRRAEARQAFEHSLQLAPGFLPPLEQLADIDLRERRFEQARDRVLAHIAKNPTSAGPQLILAKVYAIQGDTAQAEAALKKAISLQPDQSAPYLMLAQLYLRTKQQDKALANLQDAHQKDPKNPEPLMMTAAIKDQQKKYAEARDNYEQVLALEPRFSAALNNLAYLYSEYLDNLNRAYELAQRARQIMPDEPNTADTLGWILYKRAQYTWALSLLSESAEKLPGSADVQFHLGMTQYMLGNEAAARQALERALKLNESFPGREDARKALAILSLDPKAAAGTAQPLLEAAVARQTDPVALTRLGALYEGRGEHDKALAAFESALKASPNNANALLGLVAVYRGRNDTAKAIEYAKSARKVAPTDPAAARALGELAFQTRNYEWATSLLREAVQKLPDDPALRLMLGQAEYLTGHVAEAEASLRGVRDSGPATREAATLLELIACAQDGAKATAASVAIEAALKANPDSVPALMASARLNLHRRDDRSATAAYEKVLQQLPEFAPACRELAVLLGSDAKNDARTVSLASKARDAFPDDAALAKAYGTALIRQAQYGRAATVLGEAARKGSTDGELLYYLGLAQNNLKDRTASIRSLKQALQHDLSPELAAKARQMIGSTN